MLPVCTCGRSQCLNLQPLHYATSFLFLLVSPIFFYPHPLSCLCHMSHGCDHWRENADACWKHGRPTHTNKTPTSSYVSCAVTLQSHFWVLLLFSEVKIWEEYCFHAGDRPWHWCIEVHVPSFSLINMRLPGGEQMAKRCSPPAGCCRHAMGISVGTTAGPGSHLPPGFYPTLTRLSCPADFSWQN